jgi:hypothetical protein
MTGASAMGARPDDEGVVAELVIAKWLRLSATPTFAIMALLTVIFDGGSPNALSAGSIGPSGMVPMYLLMATFHLGPWLKLIFRQRNVARCDSFPVSGSF